LKRCLMYKQLNDIRFINIGFPLTYPVYVLREEATKIFPMTLRR
jgi:hypothetical protein